MQTKQLSINIPRQMKEKLRNISEDTGLSMSEIIRAGTLQKIRELEVDHDD